MNPNRLIHEKSPYLLQHAHNPVDWHAWNEETFARAAAEKQAHLSLHRLRHLPLVPCHGEGVLRRPRAARYLNGYLH